MLLGIDASRCIATNGTGVEAYSLGIIRSLLRFIHESPHCIFDRVHLYTPRTIPESILGGRYPFVEQRVLTLPRLWTQVRLSAEMLQEPPDVLFVPSHVLPLAHPHRSVVTIHDVAFMSFPEAYSLPKRIYLKFSTWLAVHEASNIIVPSQVVADDLMTFFKCPKEKIKVVHHGFSMPEIRDLKEHSHASSEHILESFGLTQKTPYVLYIGRLEEKKNIARLIEAFLQFHESHPQWKLILAGNRGVGFKHILEVVDRQDGWNNVIMPGYVTEEERDVLYRNCRFTAFVSLAEGFGFPLLESMAYEKDVLMSDLPIMHEIAKQGTFVDPFDVDAIVAGLSALAHQPARAEHRALLQSIPATYTWEKAGAETLRILSDTTARA